MPSKFANFYTGLYDGGKFLPSPHKRLLESFATWRAVSSASINHSENLGNFTNAMVLLVQCRLKGSEQK